MGSVPVRRRGLSPTSPCSWVTSVPGACDGIAARRASRGSRSESHRRNRRTPSCMLRSVLPPSIGDTAMTITLPPENHDPHPSPGRHREPRRRSVREKAACARCARPLPHASPASATATTSILAANPGLIVEIGFDLPVPCNVHAVTRRGRRGSDADRARAARLGRGPVRTVSSSAVAMPSSRRPPSPSGTRGMPVVVISRAGSLSGLAAGRGTRDPDPARAGACLTLAV